MIESLLKSMKTGIKGFLEARSFLCKEQYYPWIFFSWTVQVLIKRHVLFHRLVLSSALHSSGLCGVAWCPPNVLQLFLELINKKKTCDGERLYCCLRRKGKRNEPYRREKQQLLLYILKKQKRKQTLALYRLPLRSLTLGCTLDTGHCSSPGVFCLLWDGRFFLHTSCSELLGGTEDIELTGNESQLLGDGSWWELWCSALRQGLLDMMDLSHLFFTGWVINQPVAWETQFGWFCFNLE